MDRKNNSLDKFNLNLVTLGIGRILFHVRGLILIVLLTKNLCLDEYGLWVLYNGLISILPLLITLGLPYAMTRFLSGQMDRRREYREFYTILLFVTGISLFISLLMLAVLSQLVVGTKDQFVTNIVFCTIINIECINLVFLNYVRAKQHFFGFSLLRGCQDLSVIGLVWIFVSRGNISITNALISILISDLLVFSSSGTLILIFVRIEGPKFSLLKQYLKFGLPLTPSNLASWVTTSGDRYIIAWLLGFTFVAYYSPAYSLASLVFMILISPLSLILTPILSSHYDEGRFEELEDYMKRSLQYYHIFAIPSILGLLVTSKDILECLTTIEIANNSAHLVPIIAIGMYFSGLFTILSHSMVLTKSTDLIAYLWAFCAFLNIVINLTLVPVFGINGAAIAMIITYAAANCFAIFYIIKAKMYYFFSISLGFIGKIVSASCLMIPITYLAISMIPMQESLTRDTKVILFVGGCAIVYLCLISLFLTGVLRKFIPRGSH